MQQHMVPPEDEVKRKNAQLGEAKEERNQAIDETRGTEQLAHEAKPMVQRETSQHGLKEESNNDADFESRLIRKLQDLEEELEKRKSSEAKMFESVVSQTKKLEETKIELEESKLEIASLRKQIEKLQVSSMGQSKDLNGPHSIEHFDSAKEAFDTLKHEVQMAKENLARAEEGEKIASMKAKSLLDEMSVLKNELKLAMAAEEKSKKAMDDLALALKEVATEANHTKGKFGSTQLELEHIKGEADQLKEMVRITEDRYVKLLDEAKKEAERQKNIADRLSLEAEESLIAWNGKEKGFVDCIRITEEERALAQEENIRFAKSLKAAKDETNKLRDIMKQALNESNVAKVAASIARDENSQLKDCLAEKDNTMHFLTQENERLKSELRRLLSESKGKETDTDTDTVERGRPMESNYSNFVHEDENKAKKTFSFDLKELKVSNEHKDVEKKTDVMKKDDPQKDEALKGSIFDTNETPESEAHTPPENVAVPQRRWSSPAFAEVLTPNSEDMEHLETPHFEDGDGNDKNNHRRRKSALLKRFGDMIMRKSFQRKEAATE